MYLYEPIPTWKRYGIALGAVVLSTLLTFALRPLLGAQTHYLTFILAAIVAAWYGSWGPGLVATAVGFLAADYFFIEPLYAFLPLAEDTALLLSIGVIVSVLTGRIASATAHLYIASRAASLGTFEWIATSDRLIGTPAFASLYGLNPRGFKSNSQILIDRIHPEDVDRVKREMCDAMLTQKTEVVQEFRILLPDGAVRWMEARSRFLYDKSGKPLRTFGASIDVTERRLREIEREALMESERATRAALAASNEDLQGFANAVSHDLREPLRTISVYTELLVRRTQPTWDTECRNLANIIVRAVDQMQGLVEGLLRFCRVGYGSEAKRLVDANRVVDEAMQHLRTAIEESGSVITVDALPTVAMNEQQLLQIFMNLLGNAIKFRGSRRPEIHISVQRQGNAWQFSVSDNGIGIDPRYHDQIFGVLKRLHSSDEYGGAGIGLAIIKRAVQRSGGQVWVDSETQKGSTFYFTIPIAD